MPIIKEDPMRAYNPSTFTFKSVKGEVSDAMHFDWKRDKIDDAKKRAIGEAPTYDAFTARVKGCTLKPIHKDEFNAPPKFNFNHGAGAESTPLARIVGSDLSGSAAKVIVAAGRQPVGVPSAAVLPKNGRELDRDLRRRRTPEEKVALIELLDGDLCAKLFSKEIDAEMLREMLEALEACAGLGVARRFLRDLAYRCPNQTTTATTFLTASDRGVIARLLARDPQSEPGEDVKMCACLGLPPAAVAAAASMLAAGQEEASDRPQGEQAAEPLGGAEARPAAAAAAGGGGYPAEPLAAAPAPGGGGSPAEPLAAARARVAEARSAGRGYLEERPAAAPAPVAEARPAEAAADPRHLAAHHAAVNRLHAVAMNQAAAACAAEPGACSQEAVDYSCDALD